jgi:ATP-dependent DNA helicase RecQ
MRWAQRRRERPVHILCTAAGPHELSTLASGLGNPRAGRDPRSAGCDRRRLLARTALTQFSADVADTNLAAVLRETFGFEQFRAGQEHVIRTLLAGRDVLTIMPTGAGKSLLYPLFSQVAPGVTLVVSPLLALMQDQAESLRARGINVGVISSIQATAESDEALESAKSGATKLLYVTPERLENAEFVAEARQLSVSLFVVDEAHSISEWGQSFRPAYLNLSNAIKQLGRPPVLALTATATPWVRTDVVERLELREPSIVVRGTERTNLFLEVVRVEQEAEDRGVLGELLSRENMQGPGIIYAATTSATRDTAAWLQEWGISADYYHGQRTKRDRIRVQDAFMNGEIRVIVATNAFGMGIDKADVRFVIHRDVPSSLERYYQEAGRGGRDGQEAHCVLIYRPGDLARAAFLAAGGELTREEVVLAHARLSVLKGASLTPAEMQRASGLGRGDFLRLLQILQDERLVRRRQRRLTLVADFDPQQLPLEQEAARRAYERSRLEMMRSYAELRECRWRYILNYFGEEPDWEACGRCDADFAPHTEDRGTQPFSVGDRIVHASMGKGVVQRVTEDSITVLFETSGYKTLDIELVLEQRLVRRR